VYRDEKHYVAEWDSVAVFANGVGVILIFRASAVIHILLVGIFSTA
jgi:hypothetical protein